MTGGVRSDERGVSNLVGFVLTFAVIIASIGLVSTVGLDQLNDYRQQQELKNGERVMQLLAQNFDSIQNGRAVLRRGTVELGGGGIRQVQGTAFDVTVQTPSDSWSERITPGTLVYENGDERLAYESGAAFRGSQSGSFLIDRPTLRCSSDSAYLSFVSLTGLESDRGGGRLELTSKEGTRELLYPRSRNSGLTDRAATSVEITVDSSFSNAWADYFEETEWQPVASSDNTYQCQVGPSGSVYVRSTTVVLSADR